MGSGAVNTANQGMASANEALRRLSLLNVEVAKGSLDSSGKVLIRRIAKYVVGFFVVLALVYALYKVITSRSGDIASRSGNHTSLEEVKKESTNNTINSHENKLNEGREKEGRRRREKEK